VTAGAAAGWLLRLTRARALARREK